MDTKRARSNTVGTYELDEPKRIAGDSGRTFAEVTKSKRRGDEQGGGGNESEEVLFKGDGKIKV